MSPCNNRTPVQKSTLKSNVKVHNDCKHVVIHACMFYNIHTE